MAKRGGRKVVETDDLVFLDLSHYIFQRYYAIQRWCKIAGKEFTNDTAGKQEMCALFEQRFESSLVVLKKKLKFKWSNLYLVQDCPREQIWRMNLFSSYKQNRTDKASKDFDPVVFVNSYNIIIPRMIKQYGLHLVSYPNAEADDVIAIIHSVVRSENPDKRMIIITNDNDYLQLLDDHTTILNSSLIELKKRFDEETLKVFGMWKSIRGDTSDNIPPIERKIGDKIAQKLAMNPQALQDKLSSPSVRQVFELNKQLVMFEFIPKEIRAGIIENWKNNWA